MNPSNISSIVMLSNQTLLQFLAHSLVSLGSTAILNLPSSIHFLFSFLYHHVPLGAYILTSPFPSIDWPVTCQIFSLRFSSLSANCFFKCSFSSISFLLLSCSSFVMFVMTFFLLPFFYLFF